MTNTKPLADLITLLRAFLAPLFIFLGGTRQQDGLPLVTLLLIVNWTGDSIDGALARRSKVQYQTWIGAHDLEIDIFISIGLLGYMVIAGFVAWPVAAMYLLVWILISLKWGLPRSAGMLFQAPIYGVFILIAIRYAPITGLWLLGWVFLAIVITWPKFPKVIVPGFLNGMRAWLKKDR